VEEEEREAVMSGVKSSREAGQRREARHGGKSLLAPTLGVHTSDLGEHRLNIKQIYALDAMYQTHPAVQAARTVLHSQLLSGGIQLMRNGEAAKTVKFGEKGEDGKNKNGITEDFAKHLDENWLPFAKDIIDCFLKWGFCPVVLEVPPENPAVNAIRQLKREVGMRAGKRKAPPPEPVLIPHVPHLGTYEVAYALVGKFGYTRQYVMYNNSPGQAVRLDEEAMIFVRQHPDSVGNVNSPLATVYEQGSFTSALVELAFTAEIARSQPSIVTQLRKPEKNNQLDPGALFFDSESRNVQEGQDTEESTAAARALEMQARLCEIINKLQTRPDSGGSGGPSSASRSGFAPPDIPPKLFVLPKVHTLP